MKFISPIVLVSAASLWIGHRRWHRSNSVASLKSELLLLGGGGDKDPNNKAAAAALEQERGSGIAPQSWEDVPKPVRRYFHRVFSSQQQKNLLPLSETHDQQFRSSLFSAVRSVRSVEFKQKGYMFMNDNWLPFKANQLVSALPAQPGFVWVWEASVSLVPDGYLAWLLCWARMDVVDAWTLGMIGHLSAHLFGVYSLASPPVGEDAEDMLTRGEMQRWLAETALIPNVLLPELGVVRWKEIDDDRALMTFLDPGNGKEVELTAIFDKNDGWMTKIEGMRYRTVGKDFVLTPWIGYLSNYEFIPDANAWVPVHMEVGWMLDGKEERYFKGDNFDFKYDVT